MAVLEASSNISNGTSKSLPSTLQMALMFGGISDVRIRCNSQNFHINEYFKAIQF